MNDAQRDRWNGDSGHRWVAERRRHAGVRQNLMPHLWAAADIKPGERVLDVGCGCGENAAEAARRGAIVTGIDFSEPMLAAARDLTSEVTFVLGDAQTYPLKDFDLIVSTFGVMFFDDPVAAFANLRSGLRPGGRLAFLCWQPQSRNEVFSIMMRAFDAPIDDSADPFANPEWVSDLLAGTGFRGITMVPLAEPARIGTDVADLLEYQSGAPLVRNFEGPREPGFAAMAAEYGARQRPDGVWVTASAWLVTASTAG
ncbi:MAG TPA: methyltransferase domain-containing protein [Candidatus Limnocylindrales bacterium]